MQRLNDIASSNFHCYRKKRLLRGALQGWKTADEKWISLSENFSTSGTINKYSSRKP